MWLFLTKVRQVLYPERRGLTAARKCYQVSIILHLVDHVTRFSAAAVVKSKDRNEIIMYLFCTWISIFGTPGILKI